MGKPLQLQLGSPYPKMLEPAVVKVHEMMKKTGGFPDVKDSRPLPGIEWLLKVDRTQAASFCADRQGSADGH